MVKPDIELTIVLACALSISRLPFCVRCHDRFRYGITAECHCYAVPATVAFCAPSTGQMFSEMRHAPPQIASPAAASGESSEYRAALRSSGMTERTAEHSNRQLLQSNGASEQFLDLKRTPARSAA